MGLEDDRGCGGENRRLGMALGQHGREAIGDSLSGVGNVPVADLLGKNPAPGFVVQQLLNGVNQVGGL